MKESVSLGPTDIAIRPLGTGAMPWKRREAAGARGAFDASLDAGITLFDTAEIYSRGDSERLLGHFLRRSGRAAVVATKFAPLPHRFRPGSVSRALDGSLRRLGLQSVDLYQVHWPYSLLRIEPLMDALADEVQAGRVRAVGVSNYSADQMRRAHAALGRRGIPLAANQVHYSLVHRAPERNGVLDACREMGATLIAYTPLASGVLTGKHRPGARVRGLRRFSRPFRRLAELGPLLAELERLGREHGRTPGQVALNWLARQEGCVPIPGARDATQAAANAAALDFDLEDREIEGLDAFSRAFEGRGR